jgi:DNA-binding transcriptional ArsR family regulator
MAYSKKEEFPEQDVQLAEIAKALSHPARISILRILNEMDSCMVGGLVDQLPISQSTVSQHLLELKKADLIIGEIDGPKVCYCINKKQLSKTKMAFDRLFSGIGCC